MRVRRLRTFDLADVGNHLIHFTGRDGPRMNVGQEIVRLSPEDRLERILVEGRVRAFATFGTGGFPVVALTESVQATVRQLIERRRYVPFGVGFSKQTIFDKGGGPVLYVRGDEWDDARDAFAGGPMRHRLVRFWPGAEPDDGEELADHLLTESQWLHEREWRLAGDLTFGWDEVAFAIVPTTTWLEEQAESIAQSAGEEYAHWFRRIPAVVVGFDGNLVRDESGIWG